MKNPNTKLKFKKEPTKIKDAFMFVLIFVLCLATVVTIQLKSNRKSNTTEALNETANENEVKVETDEIAKEAIGDITQKETDYIQDRSDNDEKKNSEENLTDTAAVSVLPEKKTEFTAPCDGKIAKNFSDSELLYSKTMDDWRIHLGVDIEVPFGTEIKACEDGTVEEIKNDAEYGNTVTIRHNDILTKYSNLAAEKLPVVGDTIFKGDIIGVVGDSAETEIAENPHLHFSMCENNIYIDPNKYIKFQIE